MQAKSMHTFMVVSYDFSVVIMTLQLCVGLICEI